MEVRCRARAKKTEARRVNRGRAGKRRSLSLRWIMAAQCSQAERRLLLFDLGGCDDLGPTPGIRFLEGCELLRRRGKWRSADRRQIFFRLGAVDQAADQSIEPGDGFAGWFGAREKRVPIHTF